jgi:regulator of replication initiation timing
MALHSATRRFDLISFLKEYKSSLRVGAVVLPVEATGGEELAPEIKLDLLLPLAGRIGPVDAQVVNRLPDGSMAMRLMDPPAELKTAYKNILEEVERLKEYLLASGQIKAGGDPAEVAALQGQIQTLQAEIQALKNRVEEGEQREDQLRAELGRVQEELGAGGDERAERRAADRAEMAAAAERHAVMRERGYAIPDLSHYPPHKTGKLGDRSLRDLMMQLAIEKITGVLKVSYPNGQTRYGFWFKGGVVGWRTEPLEESEVLGVLLYRSSQLTQEQLARSLTLMEEQNVRQGEALIEMGLVTFPQLVMLLQKQAEFVLQKVVKESNATWTFHRMPELSEKYVAPPVRVAALLYKGMRQQAKELPADALAAYLRPYLDKYVYFQPDVERTVEELKMPGDELQFTKIIRSTSYRLRELFAVSNLPRSATAALIWVLNELSLLEFRAQESDARNNDRLLRIYEDRRRQMAKGTLFDRLELHWICTKGEVDAAWKRFSEEFSPQNLARFPDAQRADLERFVALGKEAYLKLVDDRGRREYRNTVTERMMIEQSAEMLAKRGDMAIMKNNITDAMDCFSKACELLPNVAEYREGLNRVRAIRNS